jgi:hypothetical protein
MKKVNTMRSLVLFGMLPMAIVAALAGAKADDGSAASASSSDTTFNAIVIGWDGVQRDHFWECYDKELPECPNGLPNVEELSGRVIFNNTTSNGRTQTKPGWTQILTGYDAEATAVYDNANYRPIPEGYTVFEKLEKHLGEDNIATLFIAGKGPNVGGRCPGEDGEILGEPWCPTKQHLDYFENALGSNDSVGNKALELLETYWDKRFFAFFHFREPDSAGHKHGESSVEYSEQIIDDDQWLGQIIRKLEELGILEHTLVYVTTDHGFDEAGYKHENAPYGILATNDPLVIRSGDRKDVAPTILQRYGLSLEADGDIPRVDGYPLDAIPPLLCVPEGDAYIDYPNSPPCCTDLELISLDIPTPETLQSLGLPTKRGEWSGCLPATGGAGDNSGYCTICRDGECEEPENDCNCPQDCHLYWPTDKNHLPLIMDGY